MNLKKTIYRSTVLTTLIAAAVFLTMGCSKDDAGAGGSAAKGGDVLQVVATIGMIADTAQNIAGDNADVIGLMGPGVDPHLYKASEGDVSRLSKADLILYNGLHLESKMGDVLEKLGSRKPTYAVAENIPESSLISVAEGEAAHDPHVWFDIELWMNVTEQIYKAFVEVDPDNKDIYETNYNAYLSKLANLSRYVKDETAKVPERQRVIITAHDAFGYFGQAYGFEVRGLQGISTAAETGTGDVRELADFIADRQIPAIFIESSVPKKNIEALQAAVQSRGFEVEIGGELFSDAMGNPGTEEGTYLGMVIHNVDTIVQALTK